MHQHSRAHGKAPLAAVCALILAQGCQSTPTPTWKPESLLIDSPAPAAVSEKLSRDQINDDISFLVYALTEGYGGRDHLPAGVFKKLVRDIERIDCECTRQDLNEIIDELLNRVPDNHLIARFDGHPSKSRIASRRQAQVGPYYFKGSNRVWDAKLVHSGKKRTAVIGISTFKSSEDPVWQGFLEKIRSLLHLSDQVILDLRGNGGGDDTYGIRLARIFLGTDYKYPVAKQYRRQSAEAFAIYSNYFEIRRERLIKDNLPVPSYLEALKSEARAQKTSDKEAVIDLASKGESVPHPALHFPLYILMDADCGSSCESTIDAFEAYPNLVRVGENTAGTVHMGNIGYIRLPHSQIEVQIPTHYNEYADLRFIEKIGIRPHWVVSPGEDAFKVVIKGRGN